MATYPIKMLQDESGQPFVPATQISAVLGEKYISSILTATKDDASHYTITEDSIMAGDVTDHLISVLFEESTDTTGLVYMRINDGTYYPIYDASGDFRSFDMAQIENTICFCSLVGGSVWQMLLTASYSPTIEVASSTDEEYILTINDINGSFDTANLKGTSGVWVGSEEPTDTSYNVWIIPEGEADFEVEDVLTSTSTTNALSANMGRELEVLITESEEKISTLETKVEELETYIEEQLGSINEALATILGE